MKTNRLVLLALVGNISYAEAINLNWASAAEDDESYAPAGRGEDSFAQTEADYWNPSRVLGRAEAFAQMRDQGYAGVTFFGPKQAN